MASRKRGQSQQARIAFTPLPSSSPAAKDYHQQIRDRAAAVRYETASPSPAKRRRLQDSSESHDIALRARYLPTPDTPPTASSLQSARHSRKKARQQRLDFAAPTQTRSSQPQAVVPQRGVANAVLSDNGSDEMPVRSAKKPRSGNGLFRSAAASLRSRGQTQLALEPFDNGERSASPAVRSVPGHNSTSDDDDDMPTTVGTRKRGSQRSQLQRSSSPPFEAPSDDDLEVVQVSTRKIQHHQADATSDEDVLPLTPHRRRLKRAKVISQQDRTDLAEDLEFLEPEDDEDTPRQPRDTQSIKKKARLNALDALKRKRAGQPAIAEQEHEEEILGQPDESYISSDPEDDPIPASSRSLLEANEEDEDFLVHDDDDALDIPEESLPLEFSKYASMKPRELFQYAVEWMVQKKINPAFNISDSLYELAFRKLDDEVSGLASSKFSSSVWTPDFTASLRCRPLIAVTGIDRSGISDLLSDKCDACNRSKHPVTLAIQFQGQPYHLETLDNVEQDDEDESDGSDGDSVDDKPGYDAQGRRVPPASKVYHVGRFCGANAETAHELAHWKFNLYDLVVGWITDHGYNTPEQVVRRDSMSAKKRRKAANKISDHMAEQGAVRRLWKEFQDTINRARESKQGRY